MECMINWAGILALGIGDIVALDFMERVFAAKNGKTAQRGAFMGAGLTIATIVPTSMMGIVARFLLPSLADPFTAYPTLAIDHMPFPIGVALLMGVLGASMSTANGGLLAISSVISRNIIQRDILRKWLKRPGMEDSKTKDNKNFYHSNDGCRFCSCLCFATTWSLFDLSI